MGFLKRLLGGGSSEVGRASGDAGPGAGTASIVDTGPGAGTASVADAGPGADETERERELMRGEARRLDDVLIQRQLRYADRSWTPPAQGGTRRAEDGDHPAE